MIYNNKAPQRKKRRGSYFRCKKCGEEFYCTPARIRQSIAHNVTIGYCSRSCYDKLGANNPFYGKKHSALSIIKMGESPTRYRFPAGTDNPNFVRFGEEYGFKGSHLNWWRRKLHKEVGVCERCGFSDNRVLEIHHKDRNRGHNTRENLELLCPNCHAIDHYEGKDGQYSYMTRFKNVA